MEAVPSGLFCEWAVNACALELHKKEPAVGPPALVYDAARLTDRDRAAQQVALPQRAMPIFSFRPSRPTAPTTTSLPIT